MARRVLPSLLLAGLTALLIAGGARADCSIDPADVAPGILDESTDPPTWRVTGDGEVTIADVVVLLRASVLLVTIEWTPPLTPGCPELPGDLAPGELDESTDPDTWTPTPDGSLTIADVIVGLRRSVLLIVFPPGSGRPDEPPSAQSDQRVVAGLVLSSRTGAGLPGVTVTAGTGDEALATTTDENGGYVFQDVSSGKLDVFLDGATATGEGTFPSLHVVEDVQTEGQTNFDPYTLPDLSNPEAAEGSADLDGTGKLTTMLDATSGDRDDIGLSAGVGTTVLVGGVVPPGGKIDVNVTPVPPNEVPMPIPGPVNANSFVTVQPSNASFDSGGGLGADVLLPNGKGFPVGTMTDVYSFDHDVGDWANRTAETGNQGTVIELPGGKTAIAADGVITEGGWHAAILAIILACTSDFTGRVVDQFGEPFPHVFITTDLGIFGETDSWGNFTFNQLPAYSGATEDDCLPLPFNLGLRAPLTYGGASTSLLVDDFAPCVLNDLGDIMLPRSTDGCITGVVNVDGAPGTGTVDIEGPASFSPTLVGGRFTLDGVTPGSYTASFTFPGEAGPRRFGFEVRENLCTAVVIQRNEGSGSRDVCVRVIFDDDNDPCTPQLPVSGALVQLFGSDGGSSEGLLGTTNDKGDVVFEGVEGPFVVSAFRDFQVAGNPPQAGRLGATVIDVDPAPEDKIGVLMIGESPPQTVLADAFIQGTVINLPPTDGETEFFEVQVRQRGSDDFSQTSFVNPSTGLFTANVPSGVMLDLAVNHFAEDGGGLVFPPIAFLPRSGLMAAPGETLMPTLDFGNAIPFDQPVSLSPSDPGILDPLSDNRSFLGLEAWGPDGEELVWNLFLEFSAGATFPPAILLPDCASPGLAGWSFHLDAEQESFGSSGLERSAAECEKKLPCPLPGSLPLSFVNRFDAFPPMQSPPDLVGTDLNWETFGGGAPNGVDIITLLQFDPPGLPVDISRWQVFVDQDFDAGEPFKSLDLPRPPLPLFTDNGSFLDPALLTITFSLLRSAQPLVFDEFFGPLLDALYAAFFKDSESIYRTDEEELTFVVPPTP